MSRILDFFDGFTSAAAPTPQFIEAARIVQYISDGAASAALAPLSGGEIYYNTTDNVIKFYNGIEWKPVGQAVAVQQTPTGLINGVNTTFVLSNIPSTDESVWLFLDGAIVETTHWSIVIATGTITMTVPPATGQTLYAIYLTEGTPTTPIVSSGTPVTAYQILTALQITNKQFTISPLPANDTDVLVDVIGGGPQAFGSDFTISVGVLDWDGYGLDGFLSASDVIRLFYFT